MHSALRRWLEEDHRGIEALLDAAQDDRAKPLDVRPFEIARERLMRHIGIEEKIVFLAVRNLPDVDVTAPGVLAQLRDARVDHAAITTLLVPKPDHALVDELRTLLGPHNVLEEAEDGLYARCDDLLGAVADDLLNAARAYPPVAVKAFVDDDRLPRTAAVAREKAERLRATISW